MRLLGNLVVRKYFGCQAVCTEAHFLNMGYDEHERCMSYRILDAMQEPIQAGDLCLAYREKGNWEQITALSGDAYWHPLYLRLPDRFQPSQTKECAHCFCRVNGSCCYCKEKKPTPPPEKGWAAGMPNLPKPPIGEYKPSKICEVRKASCGCRLCLDPYCPFHQEKCKPLPAKDEVEEQIKHLKRMAGGIFDIYFYKSEYAISSKWDEVIEPELRELVRLARNNA